MKVFVEFAKNLCEDVLKHCRSASVRMLPTVLTPLPVCNSVLTCFSESAAQLLQFHNNSVASKGFDGFYMENLLKANVTVEHGLNLTSVPCSLKTEPTESTSASGSPSHTEYDKKSLSPKSNSRNSPSLSPSGQSKYCKPHFASTFNQSAFANQCVI